MDIAAVRRRPGMYVGDTADGSGLHHMLWEVVGNSLDEHLAGRATRIDVSLGQDGSVTIADDGPGMPVHLVDDVPFAELALTEGHSTATLDGHAPHAHVGLRGVGIYVVNALSSSLVVDIFRQGHHYRQRYARGEPETTFEDLGTTEQTGTRVTFTPDPLIFKAPEMSFDVIAERLRELALLNPGLRINLDEAGRRHATYTHPEGLRGFLEAPGEAIVFRGVSGDIKVDVALWWANTNDLPFQARSFANHEPTAEHGTHVDGLRRGICDAVAPQLPTARRHSLTMSTAISRDLRAVVHVNVANPSFAGPTRDRLKSPEVTEAVRSVVAEQLAAQLRERPELEARIAARVRQLTSE